MGWGCCWTPGHVCAVKEWHVLKSLTQHFKHKDHQWQEKQAAQKVTKSGVEVTQSKLTLCNPMDYSPWNSPPPQILERVAFPFSRGSFPIQESNPGFPHCRQILYQPSHQGSQESWSGLPIPSPGDLPDPRIKPGLLHCRWILYQPSYHAQPSP